MLTYLGLNGIGVFHEIRISRYRDIESAYRRHLEVALRFKSALANTPWEGILLFQDDRVLDYNQTFLDLTDLKPEELSVMRVSDLFDIDADARQSLEEGEETTATLTGGKQDAEVQLKLVPPQGQSDEEPLSRLFVRDVSRELISDILVQPEALEHLPLSRREREVAEGILKGYNRRQLSDQLCVSPETIKKHTANIYKKLGIRSKVELARRVMGHSP